MISFDAFRAQNGSPIYLQILRYIKRGIVTGDIVDGDALPSRRMLSAMLGVNPNTIQKAYRILEEDGLITSHAGAKSVIVLNDENRASVRQELLQDDIRQTAAVLRGMGLSLAEAVELLTVCWGMPFTNSLSCHFSRFTRPADMAISSRKKEDKRPGTCRRARSVRV